MAWTRELNCATHECRKLAFLNTNVNAHAHHFKMSQAENIHAIDASLAPAECAAAYQAVLEAVLAWPPTHTHTHTDRRFQIRAVAVGTRPIPLCFPMC